MKDKSVAYLLMCASGLGFGGLHRIYLERYGTGLLYLLTWNLLGIGLIIDIFRVPRMVEEENNRLLIKELGGAQAIAAAVRPGGFLPRRAPRNTEEFEVSLAQAAQQRGGRLTVAEAVAITGRSFKDVEKALNRMVVEGYIDVDNDEVTGALVYRFGGPASG
jgi:TM2 domain-containing membrane protein YozV